MTALHLRGVVLPDGEHRDLWVRDGVISHEPVPGASTVFDGGYLLPGLVDAHCHVGVGPQGPVELDEAVTQAETDRDAGTLLIRDCGAPVDTRPLRDRADLPRIVRAGRHLARPKRYIPGLADQLEDPTRLPEAVAAQADYGDGWVKLVGDWIDRSVGDLAPLWSDDVLAEAIAAAHERGARVTAHVFGEDALPGLLAAGIDCVEHGTGLTDDTIDLMARQGTALVPTLINIENFPSFAAAATKYPRYAAHMTELYRAGDRTVSRAVEAGVPVYAGTDAGGGIEHGRLVDEILALTRVGMSAEQALGAGSWSAREWLGWSGPEHGAVADLVCYDSDPRKDPAALRHPRRIVLDGDVVA
ncbi:imidazolonepropionase-like amidohydrolase [Saccharopolyspora lacisalsi]|uniref:Imidazolonepropionase-like amidohydrolase n=1 Tax=Halosaccharopolyspora lacisalsi TaxID=1000566 RepID=A0A839DMR5_9PSEU|nr:amidohydrolase family protein [Halosaccharopolyspora lacisalsi]MBA8823252.1 imidazolonepropionase-like amidohydrolase [Halosaccharopolyspora lacisalsi]